MGRIQASTGLISGIPIQDTIDKLLTLSAQPRTLLENRVKDLKAQKLAVTELTALVIGVGFSMRQLGSAQFFDETTVSTSDSQLLSATATGKPAVGTYQYTPVRQASAHQLLSRGFASKSTPLGGGQLSVQFGGAVDKGILLDELNGGGGVQRGKIKITDRAGNSATIDLRLAVTVDDVLQAINENSEIQVTAVAQGDRIKLIDGTGQSESNLRVQQVGPSTTAADLGLAGINVAASEATGSDVLRLFDGLQLQRLNDGGGVALRKGVSDLKVELRDGSSLMIDFLSLKKGNTVSAGTTSSSQGVHGQVKITSTGAGSAFDGYRLLLVDDASVTAGNEQVAVDAARKTITVKIDGGRSRAVDVISQLNANAAFNARFTATTGDGGNGSGLVSAADTLTTAGGAPEYYNETTVGELLDTINRADPARVQARISEDGERLELIDLTSGANTFAVSSPFGGSVAADLGLTSPAVAGVIRGDRRVAGLKTVLLDSLGGGGGLGSLGLLTLVNRDGASTQVDLSSAETLTDVIDAINAANAGITARVNDARTGLRLTDTSGGSGNLVVANGDATGTADKLRVAADTDSSSVNGASLDLQTFHASQNLDSLRGGRGISLGSFLITDSAGRSAAVNLKVLQPRTVGDVIDAINVLGIGVEARINATGDGLLLVDTAGGSSPLTVADSGNGTSAHELRIAGSSVEQLVDGSPTQLIDGSFTTRITLAAGDTLQDLVTKLNQSGGDFTASLWNSGGSLAPFRLALNSQVEGSAGELVVDGLEGRLSFVQTAPGQDALLLSGSMDSPGAGLLVSSSTNDFPEVIDGIRLTVLGTSSTAQTVTVAKTADNVVSQVKLFVNQYNKLRDKLEEVASYNAADRTAGVLFSSTEALQIDFAFGDVLTSRYRAAGAIQSFDALGISPDGQGKLQFDESKFRDKYVADAQAVEQFFASASSGAAARITAAADRLTGRENSVLVNRADALQRSIDTQQRRIDAMNASLERQREQLLTEFTRLEEVIAKTQSNLTYISQIQPLSFGTSSRSDG